MDYRNDSQDLSKNTILYGHHAKDGTMFKHLMKFKDEEFFKKHPTFTFHTLEASYEAEIFAVYLKTTDFNYIQTDFGSDEEFEQNPGTFLIYTEVEVDADDVIVTLSTCDYEMDRLEGRFVVQAKLVKKE